MFALVLLHTDTDSVCDRPLSCSNGTSGSFPEGTLPVSDTDHLCFSNVIG